MNKLPSNVLDEYLVKIGWKVNEGQFGSVLKSFSSILGLTEKINNASTTKIGAAYLRLFDVIQKVNNKLFEIVDKEAELDYQMERTARQFWTTEERARSYQYALNALGETESDLLYMTEEQYARFIELNKLGQSLEPPEGANEFLRTVRDFKYEFQKLSLIINYGRRQLMYFVGQFMGKDVEKMKEFMQTATKWLAENLPKITEKIARFFWVFYRLGKAFFSIILKIGKAILAIIDYIPGQVWAIVGIITAASKVILAGPLGWIMAGLVAILLLIDDYLTWKDGGDSLFDWGKFDDFKEKLEGLVTSVGKTFYDLFIKPFVDAFGEVALWLEEKYHALKKLLGIDDDEWDDKMYDVEYANPSERPTNGSAYVEYDGRRGVFIDEKGRKIRHADGYNYPYELIYKDKYESMSGTSSGFAQYAKGSGNSNNVSNTFYITGNNSNEIADKVARQVEKTVASGGAFG